MAQAALHVQPMTLDEFVRRYDQEPFELINGEIKKLMPPVYEHGLFSKKLVKLLLAYEALGHGEIFFEIPFVLEDKPNWVKGSRVPDIMFYSATRLAAYRAEMPNLEHKPIVLVPDFVIEILSHTDLYSDIEEKVAAYLSDGVRLIWIVDPSRKTVTVYAPEQPPRFLSGEAVLRGGDVLPDFEISLPTLFA